MAICFPIGDLVAAYELNREGGGGDGKPDIIAAGRSTKNVVIYWNRTEIPQQ